MNRIINFWTARTILSYGVAAFGAATIAGCVSASKVTPIALGIFVVHGRAIAPWNADKERAKALKLAAAYCMKTRSQRVLLHDIDEKSHAVWTVENATITFECEP